MVKIKTNGDTLAEVRPEAPLDTIAHRLAQVEIETSVDTLTQLEADTLVNTLADRLRYGHEETHRACTVSIPESSIQFLIFLL